MVQGTDSSFFLLSQVDYTSERMEFRKEEAERLEKEKEAAAAANPASGTINNLYKTRILVALAEPVDESLSNYLYFNRFKGQRRGSGRRQWSSYRP